MIRILNKTWLLLVLIAAARSMPLGDRNKGDNVADGGGDQKSTDPTRHQDKERLQSADHVRHQDGKQRESVDDVNHHDKEQLPSGNDGRHEDKELRQTEDGTKDQDKEHRHLADDTRHEEEEQRTDAGAHQDKESSRLTDDTPTQIKDRTRSTDEAGHRDNENDVPTNKAPHQQETGNHRTASKDIRPKSSNHPHAEKAQTHAKKDAQSAHATHRTASGGSHSANVEDPLSLKEKLEGFVGHYELTDDVGRHTDIDEKDVLRILSSIAISHDLTEEELAELICAILCGLGTCPPSCPGYYEPPWGPADNLTTSHVPHH